jgi:type I restriction enzyme, S subunit
MSFPAVRIGDLITFQRGFDITKAEQTDGEIPIVSSSGTSSYHNRWKVAGPGIVIGRKGTLGSTHFLKSNFWPHDTTLWIKDFKGNDPKFLYYFLQTLHLENFDTGSSNPTLNRNHVHKITVRFPATLATQQKIAAILSAYDDLIANNQRRITLLERMAEDIYREWFVRLRFPGHENVKIEKGVPQGWVLKKLTDVCNITYGFPFQGERFNTAGLGRPIIRIRNIPNASTEDYTDEIVDSKYIVLTGDLLIGMDGDFHVNHWIGDGAYLVQRSCRLKAKDAGLDGYLAQAIRAPINHFQQTIVGATVGHLGAKHLNSVEVLVPPAHFLPQLDTLNVLLKQKLQLGAACRKAQATRDALLPRLISGKLSVDALDIRFPPGMAPAS